MTHIRPDCIQCNQGYFWFWKRGFPHEFETFKAIEGLEQFEKTMRELGFLSIAEMEERGTIRQCK